jgi:phosphate transport system permease protein
LDVAFLVGTGLTASYVAALVIAIALVLTDKSASTILHLGPAFLTGTQWAPAPPSGPPVFGVLPMIFGTLLTSAIAMLLGVPISIGIAAFLSEEVPSGPVHTLLGSMVELLAAVPSVVYGLWGLFVLVPFMRVTIEPGLQNSLGRLPGLGGVFGGPTSGTDVFTAGVVLAIMVIPTISAISREAMSAVPRAQREAALALGATRWETTRTSVLPYARSGIIGAVILGLGRALGETMAVTMTIGNKPSGLPTSLFSQGQTIASAIANNFGGANGPDELSALIEAGLILLLITLAVNVIARLLVRGAFRGTEVSS